MSKAKQLIQGLTKSEKKKWHHFLNKKKMGEPITISSEKDIEIAQWLGLLNKRHNINH
jgi:hypothetical protein